ncbi:MAG: elongation factor 4 [Chloroflexi bacterium]|nr:elongation factor 4 [Chloroflexota bacterium]
MDPRFIRNFCIIAHIDHGKSTLADRLLELTGTVDPRLMTEQFLDQLDQERERGITIKGKAVRMAYRHTDGNEYQLNLIDTPGHVDFSYEVSRALAACEGALLVVDASQGIQAQTLANGYLALESNLTIIPIVNKIDLPTADPQQTARELSDAFGFKPEEVLHVSAKEGSGVRELMAAVIQRVPPPKGQAGAPLRALIFDSKYDSYKGVLAYIRVFDGSLKRGDPIRMMSTGTAAEALETGVFRPSPTPVDRLSQGEVGYVATGLKNVRECRVGDTITLESKAGESPLPGYKPLKPMVFSGFYPAEGESYQALRDALEKLQLNDAALVFEPETSSALGFGFRCGFLGLLHMEIVQDRLEREYGQGIIASAPSVAYQVVLNDNSELLVENPANLPPQGETKEVREPWLKVTLITPGQYIGPMMDLINQRRGEFKRMEYISSTGPERSTSGPSTDTRVVLEAELPLSEMLVEFYDQLKSRSRGYATMDYSFLGYRAGPLVRLDILLNNKSVDTLSFIVHRDRAYELGKALVERLRELIPRQLFEVAIQAAVGSRVIARETVRPLRKNVLAKCYGGDVTRKRKLLEKQAEGKKRLKRIGQVEVPKEAFLALFRMREK